MCSACCVMRVARCVLRDADACVLRDAYMLLT